MSTLDRLLDEWRSMATDRVLADHAKACREADRALPAHQQRMRNHAEAARQASFASIDRREREYRQLIAREHPA